MIASGRNCQAGVHIRGVAIRETGWRPIALTMIRWGPCHFPARIWTFQRVAAPCQLLFFLSQFQRVKLQSARFTGPYRNAVATVVLRDAPTLPALEPAGEDDHCAQTSSRSSSARRMGPIGPMRPACCRIAGLRQETFLLAWFVAEPGYCSDDRNAETSRLRLRRNTGTEGPCASRAASISGPPTFLKFQM